MEKLTKEQLLKKLDRYKKLKTSLFELGAYFRVDVINKNKIVSSTRGLDIEEAIHAQSRYIKENKICVIYDELEFCFLNNKKIPMLLEAWKQEKEYKEEVK